MTCDRSVAFPGTAVFPTNKTDRQDRTEILLKVALNTINQPANPQMSIHIDCQNSLVDKTHNADHKLCLSKTNLDKTIFSRFKFNWM